MAEKLYLSVAEVADWWQCSERQVMELVRRGELRGARFGKSYVFSTSDLAACYHQRATRDQSATKPN